MRDLVILLLILAVAFTPALFGQLIALLKRSRRSAPALPTAETKPRGG